MPRCPWKLREKSPRSPFPPEFGSAGSVQVAPWWRIFRCLKSKSTSARDVRPDSGWWKQMDLWSPTVGLLLLVSYCWLIVGRPVWVPGNGFQMESTQVFVSCAGDRNLAERSREQETCLPGSSHRLGLLATPIPYPCPWQASNKLCVLCSPRKMNKTNNNYVKQKAWREQRRERIRTT